MKIETKIKMQKPKIKLTDAGEGISVSGLRDMDSNFVISLLEENIESRETPIEARIRKKFSGDKSKSLNIQQ